MRRIRCSAIALGKRRKGVLQLAVNGTSLIEGLKPEQNQLVAAI